MTTPTIATLTSSLTIGGLTGQSAYGRARNVEKAEINLATAVTNGLTTGQTVKLVIVPANTLLVIHAVWNKTTLVGTSYAVGDSSDEALFVNANSTTTINTYGTIATTSKTYAAADWLGVKLTAPTSGKIVVFYELIELTDNALAVSS